MPAIHKANVPGEAEQWVQVEAHRLGILSSLERSQGLACDGRGNFWFSSRNTLIRTRTLLGKAEKKSKLPFSNSLKRLGVNHIGDIDYANGKIFAPLEDGPDYKHPVIGVLDAQTLEIEKFIELPRPQQVDGVPWVAADADNRRLYSSQYLKAAHINVYDISTVAPLGQIAMSRPIDAIQGASVLNGSLYLTANADEGRKFAIYKMILATGEVSRVAEFKDKLHEVEGMTFVSNDAGFDLCVLGFNARGLNSRMQIYVFQKA